MNAMNDGKLRARQSLSRAAALSVAGNTLRVVNLTGHKLITGYPEGRRMWVNAKWYDAAGTLLREDGAYGPMTATIDGQPAQVDTILDLAGTNTRIYESHGAISQAWAQKLINVLGVALVDGRGFRPRERRGHGHARRRGGPGARHRARELPLPAERHGRQGQPHPALRHEPRRGADAERASGSREPVRRAGAGRDVRAFRPARSRPASGRDLRRGSTSCTSRRAGSTSSSCTAPTPARSRASPRRA